MRYTLAFKRVIAVLWASLWLIAAPAMLAAAPVPSSETSAPGAAQGMVEEPDAPADNSDMPGADEDIPPPPPTPANHHKPAATPTPPAANAQDEFQTVVLRVLNKVTARTQEMEAPVGSVMRTGTIEIIAHTCRKSVPPDQPEDAALLEISEVRQGEAPVRIFLGWMFSSSPALSALEHPFYDVTVIECKKTRSAQ